ncbi:MAG: hypothetical protein Unbinned2716contig1004_33 [Prokaryotic dsDNA virus sp.]|mgnify:CR=1 FL=1|nr:MAG: hypothetical protein Unbinned2716contig1004_33 [Prokaryotic dsDNA virus sp.]|tara:strand:- start:7307 stop:8452 length:1146 start_codon:yes stop_codon:yes gene_type:complete
MSKELKLDNQLDQNLKQLKVDEEATPIEISTKEVRINEKTTIEKTLQLNGDLDLVGTVGTLNFPDQIQLQSAPSDGALSIEAAGLSILSALWSGTDGDAANNDATLTLFASANMDAKILFIHSASIQWNVGVDGSDSSKFIFHASTGTLGDNAKLTLTTDGDMILAGDLAVNGDDITTDGNMNLDSGGSLTLDAHDGNFIAKKAGTEFSAANSAYAGMILGYTCLKGDGTNISTFEIQNSITVEDDTHKITFKTPPSENVEIVASFFINRSSTDTRITAGLSDQDASTGYNSIGQTFEYDYGGLSFSDDEIDDEALTARWVLSASELAAVGSSNTFWIGLGTGGSTKNAYLQYGFRSTHNLMYSPFTIKATALPASIYDGQ